MPNPSDLTYTNNFTPAGQPIIDDFDLAYQSIEDYINDRKNDVNQLMLDSYGLTYVFDQDGNAQYTNNLYDKLNAVDSYTGGDFTISTAGVWTDVDATNVSVGITPELAGDFRVVFSFSISSVSSNATNETDIRFRLTDSTTASTMLPRMKLVTGVTGTTNEVPIVISYTYDAWSAALKTVKLQYFITTTTNTTIKVLANSNDPMVFEVEKV